MPLFFGRAPLFFGGRPELLCRLPYTLGRPSQLFSRLSSSLCLLTGFLCSASGRFSGNSAGLRCISHRFGMQPQIFTRHALFFRKLTFLFGFLPMALAVVLLAQASPLLLIC